MPARLIHRIPKDTCTRSTTRTAPVCKPAQLPALRSTTHPLKLRTSGNGVAAAMRARPTHNMWKTG
eukprot:15481931-Alexandrium_andersonii.AAC.1